MQIEKTPIPGVLILTPKVFEDHRGWFYEAWSDRTFKENGLDYSFVQDNFSFSREKNTLRGLHFQREPDAQAKLVWCPRGEVLDVVADLRKGSPTYLRSFSVILTEQNKKRLLIPRGLAHGYLTLTDHVEFAYKADRFYAPENDRNVRWNDPSIQADWGGTENPILSARDAAAPFVQDCNANFVYDAGACTKKFN